jgi:hypothetical protein
MQFKTPEQRSASAKKAHATRKANKEWLDKKRQDALIYPESLKIQIVALETRLAELSTFEKMSVVSAALTNELSYATANKASLAKVKPEIAQDKAVFPDAANLEKMVSPASFSNEARASMANVFTAFKKGQ